MSLKIYGQDLKVTAQGLVIFNPNQTRGRNGPPWYTLVYLFIFFLYVFCWKNEYILDISRISQEGLEKTFIDLSNNKFPVETGIIKLFHYICGI